MDEYQVHPDGPLTDEFKDRILNLRSRQRLSINKLAIMVSLSGVYLSQILRKDNSKPLRTVHLRRLIGVIEDLEKGRTPPLEVNEQSVALEDVVRRANSLGFEVSFRPLKQ